MANAWGNSWGGDTGAWAISWGSSGAAPVTIPDRGGGTYYKGFGSKKRRELSTQEVERLLAAAREIVSRETLENVPEIAAFVAETARSKSLAEATARVAESEQLMARLADLMVEIERLEKIQRIAALKKADEDDAIAVLLMGALL